MLKFIRNILKEILLEPFLLRRLTIKIIKYLNLGRYDARLHYSATKRPQYGYCVYQAASLAKKLGYKKISVLEFGVAGGRGLLILEEHAHEISKLFDIDIEIYGFDSGNGLPAPTNYKDIPYIWKKGFFKMDYDKLVNKLNQAKLIIGEINDTIESFFTEYNPAPVGAIIHDFDYYSSTSVALKMFNHQDKYFLPRICCYFDDTIGNSTSLFNDYTGERLAINEFNINEANIKITKPYYFINYTHTEDWHHQIWIIHLFIHRDYNTYISFENKQLKI